MEERTISDRLFALLTEGEEAYNRLVGWLRQYTPYVVRTIEIVLAVALLALLTHWVYWFYTAA
ncbi:hypothetical protein [Halorubrum sp. DTA98]|uniref:hypothetical protein n=1 Tax=Halorubrum sp. DTA98 TaxID=3402163 RepID=UPI003AAED804